MVGVLLRTNSANLEPVISKLIYVTCKLWDQIFRLTKELLNRSTATKVCPIDEQLLQPRWRFLEINPESGKIVILLRQEFT